VRGTAEKRKEKATMFAQVEEGILKRHNINIYDQVIRGWMKRSRAVAN
jgi:hypothetical protein